MDRATQLAELMADHALAHSRKSFKVAGGRDAMIKQFEPYAEIIADLENIASRNEEVLAKCNVFLDRQEKMMISSPGEAWTLNGGAPKGIPDTIPRDWS